MVMVGMVGGNDNGKRQNGTGAAGGGGGYARQLDGGWQ
jgi:hypothetical protein